jgi:hypothetical protein
MIAIDSEIALSKFVQANGLPAAAALETKKPRRFAGAFLISKLIVQD